MVSPEPQPGRRIQPRAPRAAVVRRGPGPASATGWRASSTPPRVPPRRGSSRTTTRTSSRAWRTPSRLRRRARSFDERDRMATALERPLLPMSRPPRPRFESRRCTIPPGSKRPGRLDDDFGDGDVWYLAIGDVCGKDPDAAAIMGMTRVALGAWRGRTTSAAEGGAPSAQPLPPRERADGDASARSASPATTARWRASVTTCLGGHPPPFVARADGSLPTVGEPGRCSACSTTSCPRSATEVRAAGTRSRFHGRRHGALGRATRGGEVLLPLHAGGGVAEDATGMRGPWSARSWSRGRAARRRGARGREARLAGRRRRPSVAR